VLSRVAEYEVDTMRIVNGAKLALAALPMVAATAVIAAPFAARAEIAGGVVGCDASGNKQAGGALLGAVIGGVAGNSIARHDHGTNTLIGATAGAAAGSFIGCHMQKSDAAKAAEQPPPPPPVAQGEATRAYPATYYDDEDRYVDERGDDGRFGPPGLAKKRHHMPPGLAKKYYGVGERLPVAYVGEPRHYLAEPRRYGLRYPPAGSRWVVVDHDAYLVQTRTGVITEVVRALIG
jgi:Ni/Co efflux regulator RcnB